PLSILFFFPAPATPETSPLSLHDALPIWDGARRGTRHAAQGFPPGLGRVQEARLCRASARHRRARRRRGRAVRPTVLLSRGPRGDRKSTRLNSSHLVISYAVFCLKKKNKK